MSLPGYMLASTGNFFLAIVGQLLVALPWSFVVSAVVVIIVEIFPTRVRYSGASIGYNLGYMIFGGTAPIVATYLVSATGSDAAPAIYLIVVALLVFPAVFLLPETRGLSLLRGAKEARSRPRRDRGAALMGGRRAPHPGYGSGRDNRVIRDYRAFREREVEDQHGSILLRQSYTPSRRLRHGGPRPAWLHRRAAHLLGERP